MNGDGLSGNNEKSLTRGYKKKARTRQALVEAAMRIYSDKGVVALTLNDLAEEAGVSHGTVYNYFKTREEVLQAVGIELADQLSNLITEASRDIENGAERVAVGVRMFIRQGKRDPVWAGAVTGIFQHDHSIKSVVANNLQQDLKLGLEQGHFCIKNEIIAMSVVASSTFGAISLVVEGLNFENYDAIVAEMILLALGVAPAKAKEISNQALPEPPRQESEPKPVKKRRGRPPKVQLSRR